uniref:Uncharacterized protein n=1 Tax=Manihot esculenta TaxID=3983 RepID=A0A2C9WE03_MANES
MPLPFQRKKKVSNLNVLHSENQLQSLLSARMSSTMQQYQQLIISTRHVSEAVNFFNILSLEEV